MNHSAAFLAISCALSKISVRLCTDDGGMIASLANGAPRASVARDQFLCSPRSGSARRIVGEFFLRWCVPRLDQRVHHLPRRLDLIGTLKERGVTLHAIVKQCFIAHRRRL